MKIAIVQFNPIVGDLIGNADRIIDFCCQAAEQDAVAIVFPELAISGYPPEDLLLRDDFIQGAEQALARIANSWVTLKKTKRVYIIVWRCYKTGTCLQITVSNNCLIMACLMKSAILRQAPKQAHLA